MKYKAINQPIRQHGHLSPRRQKGAVLVVSLLMLLVLTLLGISSMNHSSLEEKMAHATLDRNVALQSAEAALREAENWLESIVATAALTGNNGLYGLNATAPDYSAAITWDDTTTNHVVATAPEGSNSAQYFIKEIGSISSGGGALNLPNNTSGDVTTFRITARGAGGAAGGAEVLLRSHYGRIF
ncbi:MAG: hypothetical protein JKY90_02145 [Gammaproteobacteria bacterium]|nr:hypothetical protein [Gammaproteobacteria bacterium]